MTFPKPARKHPAGAKFGTRPGGIRPVLYQICPRPVQFWPLRAEILGTLLSTPVSRKSEEAAGVIRIAIKRMTGTYPFHTHLLSMAVVEEDSEISTMAVTVRAARVAFLYNPEFVLAHQFEEIVGVLHHEVLHIVLGHLMQSPARYPDQAALTIAQEVTVNEWVPEPLPGQPILLQDFPRLPPEEDTETRYQRLATRHSKSQVVLPLDIHEAWEEARAAGRVAETVITSAVKRASDMLTQDELTRILPGMIDAIAQACRGKAAGRAVEKLATPTGTASVSWKTVLRMFLGRSASRQSSYLRPPRRSPDLVGIVPGNTRRMDRPRVMAVIDTSASMTDGLLKQICAELNKMRVTHKVVVLECDSKVHRTYEFEGKLSEVQGRGGTDLRPPFEPDILNKLRPDVVVYFTDGEGPAPKEPPRVPVLWCLTAGAEPPVAWGRTVWTG